MRLRLFACALLLQPGLVRAQQQVQKREPRPEFETVQVALDAAVARVSRPASAWPSHPAPSGYRLRGYGVVVVLPARALPAQALARGADPQLSHALAEARRTLEQSLATADSPEMREQIQRSLEALRQTQAHLGAPVAPPPQPIRLPAGDRIQVEAERQLEAMHSEMEAFRREAEQAREDAEREIRARLQAPTPAIAQLDPPLPPWHFWFESTTVQRDPRNPDSIVAAVRAAVASVFESQHTPFDWLAAEESLAVAVDFRPRNAARSKRGLLVRIRQSDVAQLRTGVLSLPEFRKRIEYDEWPSAEPPTPAAAAAAPPTPTLAPHP